MMQKMPKLGKLVRYGAVSATATTVSLAVLGALVATRTLPAGWANVVATAVGTVPSFELNRRWVWSRSGRRSIAGEIGPFCVMSFAGLALSTIAVGLAAAFAQSSGFSAGMRTLTIEAAHVSGFGALWVAQFVILDRVLFATSSPDSQSAPDSARSQDLRTSSTPLSELRRSVSPL